MAALILIKHSHPEINPTLPPSQWRLSEIGRARCQALAEQVAGYAPDCIVASHELKAIETAQLLAAQLHQTFQIVAGLHEHDRSNVPWGSVAQFEAQVAEFFRQPHRLVMGKETASQAQARFAQAVAGVIAEHPQRTIAVVAHGTVITLLVAQAVGIAAFPLWMRLGLPAFVVLSLPKLEWVTSVESVD